LFTPEKTQDTTDLSLTAATLATARAVDREESGLVGLYGPVVTKSTHFMLSELSRHVAGRSITDHNAEVAAMGMHTMHDGFLADLVCGQTEARQLPFMRARELEVATVGLYMAATRESLAGTEAADVLTSTYFTQAWTSTGHDPTEAYDMVSTTLGIDPEIAIVQGMGIRRTMVMTYAGAA